MRIDNIRERLSGAIFRPRLDEQALNETLGKARAAQPPPVVWLLGRTQSGKTSIIRSLTGSPDADIGNGFQSCTKASRFYDHQADAPVVRFLDTQRLVEVSYDPPRIWEIVANIPPSHRLTMGMLVSPRPGKR